MKARRAANRLTVLGLLLTLIGSALLFFYGLPRKKFENVIVSSTHAEILEPIGNERRLSESEWRALAQQFQFRARILNRTGFGLVAAGTLLQMVAFGFRRRRAQGDRTAALGKSTMKIFAALREDTQQGWVWLQDPTLPPRSIIKIKNKDNRKSVYCEALQIDSNFLKSYNESPRTSISNPRASIVISAWYRAALGGLSPRDEIELEVAACNSWRGKFLACIDHPQTVVRVAAWLGLVGVGLGAAGVLLGALSFL